MPDGETIDPDIMQAKFKTAAVLSSAAKVGYPADGPEGLNNVIDETVAAFLVKKPAKLSQEKVKEKQNDQV